MTIDDIIKLARVLDNDHRFSPPVPCRELAHAVLALLKPDKPCGWEASDVAEWTMDGGVSVRLVEKWLSADEARWCAIQILRTAEKAEVTRG